MLFHNFFLFNLANVFAFLHGHYANSTLEREIKMIWPLLLKYIFIFILEAKLFNSRLRENNLGALIKLTHRSVPSLIFVSIKQYHSTSKLERNLEISVLEIPIWYNYIYQIPIWFDKWVLPIWYDRGIWYNSSVNWKELF